MMYDIYAPVEYSERKVAENIRIACSKVRLEHPGSVYFTLYIQSCVLGSYIKRGWLDEYEATNLLIKAITDNVHTTADYDDEHNRLISNGITCGKTLYGVNNETLKQKLGGKSNKNKT